jgi:hypothetical protein
LTALGHVQIELAVAPNGESRGRLFRIGGSDSNRNWQNGDPTFLSHLVFPK